MKRRRLAPPKPIPIVVKGPDTDYGRTIAKLERDNRRLDSMNRSLEGLIRQIEAMDRKYGS